MRGFVFFEAAIEVTVVDLPRQIQCAQNQLTGFIPSIVGAVTEKQLVLMKLANGKTNMVAQGKQAAGRHKHLCR